MAPKFGFIYPHMCESLPISGTSCYVECKHGFISNGGVNVMHCGKDGKWNKDESLILKCLGIPCFRLISLLNNLQQITTPELVMVYLTGAVIGLCGQGKIIHGLSGSQRRLYMHADVRSYLSGSSAVQPLAAREENWHRSVFFFFPFSFFFLFLYSIDSKTFSKTF